MTTLNDNAVLNRILNPLLPAALHENELRKEEKDVKEEGDSEGSCAAVEETKLLEVQGVKCAESGRLNEALEYFNQAISRCPQRPSCYNNRAQALRLKGNVDEALADLNKALELSKGRGKAACQAYTQRALIFRLKGRDEEAKKDFEKASALGSFFAKNQLVMMNPYAAMCNKMMAQVMAKVQQGIPEDQPTPGPPA